MSSASFQTASICAQVVSCGEVLNANRITSRLVGHPKPAFGHRHQNHPAGSRIDIPAGAGPRCVEVPPDHGCAGSPGASLRRHRASRGPALLVRDAAARGLRGAERLADLGKPDRGGSGRGLFRRRYRRLRSSARRVHRRPAGDLNLSSSGHTEAMDPVTALRQIAYYKDRAREDSRRVMAYRNAADIVERLDDAERERYGQANSWQSLPGIGPKTAKVIDQAWCGREPDVLVELRAAAEDLGGGDIRAALRGDLHLHSNWSDGSAPIEEMMATAAALGHEYCALTDHSPRLTIANGLSPERLRKQLDVIDGLRERFAPMRILTGIEVDILDDGSLDQEPELLERLDIVVASVHSKLSMDSAAMTRRMVRAVSDGHADVLGHCTGRLVAGNRGIRPESTFDAEAVFTACRDHGTAVEINSRPERRDPPTRLLNLALEIGCVFSIDTDAHAPGQLDFLGYGAQRALDAGVPVDRIINTWPLDRLLEWTASVG